MIGPYRRKSSNATSPPSSLPNRNLTFTFTFSCSPRAKPTACFPMPLADATTCLHTALRLARQYRWVSDWLFTNPTTPFHTDLILPPASLNAAIAWRLRKNIRLHPLDTSEMRSEMDCILIPVAYMSDIIVGYTLGAGTGRHDACFDFMHPDNPFDVPFKGRFVYDTSLKEMLHIVQKRADQPVGVHFMRMAGHGRFDECTFVVPNDEYSFDSLPSQVNAMAYTPDFRLDGMDERRIKECDETSLAVTDCLLPVAGGRLDGLTSVAEGDTSYMPWIVGRNGLADGRCVSFNPVHMDISSGAFCYRKLMQCLALLGDSTSGLFYCPTTRLDMMQGAGLCSLYTGNGFDVIRQLDGERMERLKQLFAASYFVSVLGATVDRQLLGDGLGDETVISEWDSESAEAGTDIANETQGADSQKCLTSQACADGQLQIVKQDAGNVDAESGRSGEGKQDLSRRAAPIAPAPSANFATGGPADSMKETIEERMARRADERRRRNRLSAARSNTRRKLAMEAMKNEISSNWEKVKWLEGRKDALMEENERLKQMIGMMGAGG